MLNLPFKKQFILPPIIIIVLMLLLELNKPFSLEFLAFYPTQIVDGQLWRLITGQLLHTNFNHMLLNTGGIVLIWALHGEYYSSKNYLLLMLSCLFLIGLGLLIFADYQHYAGMSAALHSFIIIGAAKDIQHHDKTGWLLLIGVIIKVGYENIYGASEQTKALINANVAVEAHLIGVVVGLLVAVFLILTQKRQLI